MSSKFYLEAENNLKYIIKKISDDEYLNQLLYANIITILETYLYKTFTFLLEKDFKLLKKLTESSKFKNQKVSLKLALSDIKQHIFTMIRNLTYHNLADIDVIYKEVLNIKIKYDEDILNSIEKRHDIIHRNGYKKDGRKIFISKNEIIETVKLFQNLVKDIDMQIMEKYKDKFK
jgi:uncharacterized protein YegP (UPF0339 family)